MKPHNGKTRFADQERLVSKIASLFPKAPNDVIADPESATHLRSTIDYAVHFNFYLKEQVSEPINLEDDELENLKNDIVAYIEYFWTTHSRTSLPLRKRRAVYRWKGYASLQQLKREYFRNYRLMVARSTSPKDRYYHLMVLAKLQIVFLGSTFI